MIFKNRLLVTFFLISFVLINSCKKKGGDLENPQPSKEVIANNTNIKTDYSSYSSYEMITVKAVGFLLPSSNLNCYLGNTKVVVIQGNSEQCYIIVPGTISPGNQELRIEGDDVNAKTSVSINTQTNPEDGMVYLKNYINTIIADLKTLVNKETDQVTKDSLLLSITKLELAIPKVDIITENEAELLSNYFYANRRTIQEFENNLAGIDKNLLTSPNQRLSAAAFSTIDKYKKCMEGIGILLNQGKYRKVGQATILTALMGVGDIGESLIDLTKAILNGEGSSYIQKAKGMFVELKNWCYWAPVAAYGVVIDNFKQSISHRLNTNTIEIKNNTKLTFENYKITYRNFQEDDKNSSFTDLAELVKAFIVMRGIWNGFSNNIFDIGVINFTNVKTVDKFINNLNNLSITSSNPDINIGEKKGVASNFNVTISTSDNTSKSGYLIVKYTDEIEQVSETKYDLSVIPFNGLEVGQIYQGGIIACIFNEGTPGYIEGETHGLIAAPSDQGGTAVLWGCEITNIMGGDMGLPGFEIGTGNQNTIHILQECTSAPAAKLCYDLDLGGYADWYLPSKDELSILYNNRSIIGGFVADCYWTSSWDNSDRAWYQFFKAGTLDGYQSRGVRSWPADFTTSVRAVRSF
jgi:hypothetical protein